MRDNVDLSQRDSVSASVRGIVVSLYLAFSVHAKSLPFCLFLGWLMHASHMLSYRICSGPLTLFLLRDSANQKSMSHRD